jgi:hypothetical protein
MMKFFGRALLMLIVMVVALPEPAWGRGFHHHRHRSVFVGGFFFGPQLGEHYPDVQECPGGWQRVIRATQATAQGE